MRDYGTAGWQGGDESCDHLVPLGDGAEKWNASDTHERPFRTGENYTHQKVAKDECPKCGATRTDQQLGLESTPEKYVTRMVEVFREVRRVLAAHGTVWLNLGDSYAGGAGGRSDRADKAGTAGTPETFNRVNSKHDGIRLPRELAGLKPKDLVGIPWRIAFALQADGWYLRSDIIWAKPNPMPESVTDRPTKAHEYVFLLSKQPRYFWDAEAVREKAEWARWGDQTNGKHEGSESAAGWIGSKSKKQLQGGRQARRYDAEEFKTTDERNTRFQGPNPVDGGRNIRSVWEIATQPYPEAHFATFPEELARRAILAGTPEVVCRVCGKARERITERLEVKASYGETAGRYSNDEGILSAATRGIGKSRQYYRSLGMEGPPPPETTGFTDCGCPDEISPSPGNSTIGAVALDGAIGAPREGLKYRPGIVLDPFMGSGTVAHVARKLGRHSVGIDLNESYLALAARRLQQQSLFAEASA